ncbi:hypothetical protein [Candidatus Oscillochloris fontis]|uniref:hypothetical protein n=1 Tax=Candidatus Oscillochloris fontis TaxID=2496868 RepID=UPI00101C9109|nr:hypothetical protein [Candidatus Oscillochloris fontis]
MFRRFFAIGALLLLVILISLGLVGLARLRVDRIDLGLRNQQMTDSVFHAGFYQREFTPNGEAYRWTSSSVVIQLRNKANLIPAYLLKMRLRSHPAGAEPFSILSDGQVLATSIPDQRFRTYYVLAQPTVDGELRLNLRTTTFVSAQDLRPLGLFVTDLTLRPIPQIDWLTLIVVALGLSLLAGLLIVQSTPIHSVVVTLMLAGFGLALVASGDRPPTLPFAVLSGSFLLVTILLVSFVRPTLVRLGLISIALTVTFSGILWPTWLTDDAFISFRYAQNLVEGHGLVYNVGERVEGYTNFLWTMIAAGVLAVGGDLVVWSYLSGIELGLAIMVLSYIMASRLYGPYWGLAATLLVATSQSLLLYTARGAGLETGFFALLVLAASGTYLLSQIRRSWLIATGLLLAAAAMTRPEGILVCGLTVGHLLILGPTPTPTNVRTRLASGAWLLGTFLLIFLPYFLWRWNYYGDLLPNTFYAKTGGGWSQILRGLTYAGSFAITLGGPLLLLIFWPWWKDWRTALHSWRSYLLLLALTYTAYIIAVGGDHFRGERFFVPVLPWLVLLLVDGIASLTPPQPKRIYAILVALAFGLGGTLALLRTTPIDKTISGMDQTVWIWREIGWWMADHSEPSATIAAQGAGAIAYYSQRSVIDLFGLTEKHIARMSLPTMGQGVAGHEKHDPVYVLQERRPTYIPQIWESYFGGPAGLRDQYRLITITTRSGREMQLWERLP